MATDSSDIREELDALGERRKAHDEAGGDLTDDINAALGRARGKVSMAEAARRLGLHRTTLYRVYDVK
jgi:transcriptional regulator of acetoin/glycerol metabolism